MKTANQKQTTKGNYLLGHLGRQVQLCTGSLCEARYQAAEGRASAQGTSIDAGNLDNGAADHAH